MTEQPRSDAVQNAVDTARDILSERWGQPIHLIVAQEFFSQHTVLRCTIDNPPPQIPSSVILKIVRHHDHDRRGEGLNSANRFFNEWGGLQFLSTLDDGSRFAPPLIAANEESGILISTDLGDYPSLIDILEGNDRKRAENAIIQAATTLGKMHAASIGHADRYWEFVEQHDYLPPLVDGNVDLRKYLFMVKPMFEELGVETSEAFWDEFIGVETRLHVEGPFYGFTHFDLGPHNMLALNESVRLMDFEMAKFGNVFIDAVDPRMNFSSCTGCLRIPIELVEKWERAHRQALAANCSAAADDTQYFPAMVDACAHWAIQKTGGFYGGYLKQRMAEGDDFETKLREEQGEHLIWLKTWTLTRLRSFMVYAEEHDCLPHIRETTQCLIARFEHLMPEVSELGDLALFPAFNPTSGASK